MYKKPRMNKERNEKIAVLVGLTKHRNYDGRDLWILGEKIGEFEPTDINLMYYFNGVERKKTFDDYFYDFPDFENNLKLQSLCFKYLDGGGYLWSLSREGSDKYSMSIIGYALGEGSTERQAIFEAMYNLSIDNS